MTDFVEYRETLPFRAGETVVLPAGITVRSTNSARRTRVAVRKQTVRLHRVDNGSAMRISEMDHLRERFPENKPAYDRFDELMLDADTNPNLDEAKAARDQARKMYVYTYSKPELVWVAGGYWCSASITDAAAANRTF